MCAFFFFLRQQTHARTHIQLGVMATCDICGDTFANAMQLGPHKRRCWRQHCVNVGSDFSNDDSDDGAGSSRSRSPGRSPSPSPSPAGPAPAGLTPLHDLAARRCGYFWGLDTPAPNPRVVVPYNKQATHDYTFTQNLWREYVEQVFNLCAEDFWLMYATVQHASTTCADAVLREVHRMLQQAKAGIPLGHKWPRSLR